MGRDDVDPLAVLPLTAASASAAFARASDPWRDDAERRQQLTFLEVTLAALRELLDRCEQETARLAGQMDRRIGEAPCQGARAVCGRSLGEPFEASRGTGQSRKCSSTVEPSMESARCPDAAAVVLRDLTGDEQALCLSHAAVAVRRVHHLSVVAASRYSRAVLSDVAAASCTISRRVQRLADATGAASQ
jgi:hypothetical protein